MREAVDLVLMDVCTAHDESGIEACAVLKKKFKKIKVIVVTSMAEHTFLEKAREARADSFWYKDASHGELIAVMDRTMDGEHIFPDKTPEVKLGLTTSYELTHFELDVLRALMQSTGDEDAANMLGCTKANIRWHVSKILEKTGYRTRMELLIAVAQKNLIIVTPDRALDEENF
jgi:two-component system vancomycin resistance associated response regulator VraR